MHIKQAGKTILRMIAATSFSGLTALLLMGALIIIFGLFFWGLDTVFDFVNLSPRFEYGVLSQLRSAFFWLDNTHIQLTFFFVLWVIIFFVFLLKKDWIKKKLTLTKRNQKL